MIAIQQRVGWFGGGGGSFGENTSAEEETNEKAQKKHETDARSEY